MAGSSRRKGHDYEREVAKAICEALGVDARRGQQARRGEDAPDVVGVPGWRLECKYGKRATLSLQLEQGWGQAAVDHRMKPALVFRQQRGVSRVVLTLTDFLELLATVRRQAELIEAHIKTLGEVLERKQGGDG